VSWKAQMNRKLRAFKKMKDTFGSINENTNEVKDNFWWNGRNDRLSKIYLD